MVWVGMGTTARFPASSPPLGLESIAKMEPQQRAHLKCQLVHARVCKVIFQSSSDSGSENENENATQLNRTEQSWTKLNCFSSQVLSASHVPTYFNLFHIRTWKLWRQCKSLCEQRRVHQTFSWEINSDARQGWWRWCWWWCGAHFTRVSRTCFGN